MGIGYATWSVTDEHRRGLQRNERKTLVSLNGIYLAYPIDQMSANTSTVALWDQVENMKQMLVSKANASWVFDPGDAFLVGGTADGGGVAHINRVALNSADCVVAFLPAEVASIGVPMEIDRARAQGKHVVVFSDANSWMLEMSGVTRFGDWSDESLYRAIDLIAGWFPPDQVRQRDVLPVKLDGGVLPQRAFDDDAGLDLVVSEATTILPGTFQDVPCGLAVELPSWSWGLVTGRSSALRKRGLLVHSGVIDAGYRGPIYSGAWNMTDQPVIVEKGERIAQLIVLSNMTRHIDPIETQGLTKSARGESGFGSTGA